MPIYEYYCKDCTHTFDVFHSIKDEYTDGCSLCESENITRVIPDLAYSVKKENFKTKAGDVVKSHIEEASKDLKEEKSRMKREEMK